jgi:hypothetical protein
MQHRPRFGQTQCQAMPFSVDFSSIFFGDQIIDEQDRISIWPLHP